MPSRTWIQGRMTCPLWLCVKLKRMKMRTRKRIRPHQLRMLGETILDTPKQNLLDESSSPEIKDSGEEGNEDLDLGEDDIPPLILCKNEYDEDEDED
eukprot:4030942-Ditylum_brightwellii.AAC.1